MTTTYRYLFADLLTNEIVAELPITGVSFTQQLNQAGAFSAHLLLSGVNTFGYNVDASTQPTRNAIYVDRNGVLVWGGVIWSRSYNTHGGVNNRAGGEALHKNYAGIGYTFDGTGFAAPQPFASWSLNSDSYLWEAPTPMPTDGIYTWDEANLAWEEVTPPTE